MHFIVIPTVVAILLEHNTPFYQNGPNLANWSQDEL